MLDRITCQLGAYIERTWDYSKLWEAKNALDKKASSWTA